jgi:hypothetical protein
VSGVVKFKIEVIFFIKLFFAVVLGDVEVDSFHYKFFMFFFRHKVYLFSNVEVFRAIRARF